MSDSCKLPRDGEQKDKIENIDDGEKKKN